MAEVAGIEYSACDGGEGGLEKDGDDEAGDDVDDFDHGVNRGASGVFVGIADGIACDGGGVGEGSFASVISFFDIFFSVVPSSAGGGHGDGDKEAGDDGADENSAEDDGPEAWGGGDGDDEDDGEKCGDDHLAESGFGDDVDAGSVVRFLGAFENAGFGGELAPDLADDSSRSDADGVHGAGGKDEGEEATNEEADDDFGFREGELEAGHGGA